MNDENDAPIRTVYRLIKESQAIDNYWVIEHSLLDLNKSGVVSSDFGHFNCILYPKLKLNGVSFKLELIVTGNSLPTVRFEKPLFHPYVDENRYLCLPLTSNCKLDIQKDPLKDILEYIRRVFILQERSEKDECYNATALKEYNEDQDKFFAKLSEQGSSF
ncbi:hypothetical protein TVAG_486800 [Trichomonas vaginalis G3]|uniref:Uncharacterized protein n=1 Tax=Trichomonas vaginalis (strain ATCC PRA-98 / G3) TaxID=412133 RepID=A2DZA8_TRIV3|nr:UBC-like family [Trichomonas vaginalis G3]EAY14237.1 hypothetical protein TVAG_486800 [Trichomonas vaginalis G3]KAI5491905.1 UBC-like family [Trichomonas vaginalis G3]|eukprot:XP_001326460.1 hypothetical protein [Trichomonas vaginalis G3]